jgi:hypothetical protein
MFILHGIKHFKILVTQTKLGMGNKETNYLL